jgi:copper chaperone CopZ
MRRPLTVICVPLCAVALAACGTSTVSTSSFKGAKQAVAQTIANLQSDATAAEEKKICTDDLAAAVVAKLGGVKSCEAAIKTQIAEVDSLEASVQSVTVAPSETTATAQVNSIHQGKHAIRTLTLVKESGKWKISGL